MSRADKILNESSELIDLDFLESEDEESFWEDSVINYIDDRGGICVLEDGSWCFSDELEEEALEEGTVRKMVHSKMITKHTLTGARKTAAAKVGRQNIKSNKSLMTRKAHTAATERIRRKTMEKLGLWKHPGAVAKKSATPKRPSAGPKKSPMGSRMKSRL